MRKNILFKAIIVAIFGFLLSYFCYQLSDAKMPNLWVSWSDATHIDEHEQPLQFADVKNVVISAESVDVDVVQSEEERGQIYLSPQSAGAVSVTKVNEGVKIQVINHAKSIKVVLPVGIHSLVVESVSGHIKVEQNHAKITTVKSVSGDVVLTGISDVPVTVDVSTVSGNIIAMLSGVTKNKIVASSSSGDVKIGAVHLQLDNSHGQPGEVNVHSVSGNITVKTQ